MYCKPTTTRLAVGMFTPAMRAKFLTPSTTYGALTRARNDPLAPEKRAIIGMRTPESTELPLVKPPIKRRKFDDRLHPSTPCHRPSAARPGRGNRAKAA